VKVVRRYWVTCVFVIFGFSTANASAEEIVLYTIHLPPHIIDASLLAPPSGFGEVEDVYGSDVEVLRAAYATQGVSVRIELRPWKRIMRDVEAGLVLGAVSCRPIPSRERFAIFSDDLSDSANAFVTRRSFLDDEVPTLDILKKYNVAAVNGWSQTNILDSADIPYSSVSGLEQGINVLLRRNQDVFMTERDSAIFAAKRMQVIDSLSFYDVSELGLDHYTTCFSRSYPEAEKWRDVLNKGLKELGASGKREEILKKYSDFFERQ
jgi:polar amino acid transport system substrate-binding protein|tara:strand:- start:988 stop:1782 length:795 start_codon:yes stop_codon:yes gene_type:complete